MAGTARTLDTDTIQVRTVFARTATNGFIPSSHILIANGDGSTQWNSYSTIHAISSFKTVQGNSGPSFSADLYNRTLRVSTTGVQGVLESYVDPATSSLMLSNYLPPTAINEGSIPLVTLAAATNLPTQRLLTPVTGQSTIKFLGVGDIQFSTVTSQNAAFVSISSYTSVGYSTISGETFAWRPTLYSTLSTAVGRPSFISTMPFVGGAGGWNWGSNLALSSVGAGNADLYFSSITFNLNQVTPYMDLTNTSSTRIFMDYRPQLFFSTMIAGNTSMIKEVSTFIQFSTTALGTRILPESVQTHYITSQVRTTNDSGLALSNFFNTPMLLPIDGYSSFYGPLTSNGGISPNFTIYHRFVQMQTAGTASGLSNASLFVTNLTPKNGGLFLNLQNAGPLLP